LSFATQGTILGRGRIKILCPAGVKLLQPLRVSHAVGALSSATSFDVEVEPYSRLVIVNVHGSISKGYLSFQLNEIFTPIGLAAGTFEISTTDYGNPDRIFDSAVHHLINPVDLENWWDGDAASPLEGAALASLG